MLTDGTKHFTLIEVLIATFILAIGMTCIMSVFPYAIRNVTMAVNKTKSASIATNVFVTLRYYDEEWGDPTYIPDEVKGTLIYLIDNNFSWSGKVFKPNGLWMARVRIYHNDMFVSSYVTSVGR